MGRQTSLRRAVDFSHVASSQGRETLLSLHPATRLTVTYLSRTNILHIFHSHFKMSAATRNQQDSYEAIKERIKFNMLSIVLEDILVVAPEHVNTPNKVSRAYHTAREEAMHGYYEHLCLGNPHPEVLVEAAVEWATAIQLWMKFVRRNVEMCPALVFRAECEEHLTRPSEAWLHHSYPYPQLSPCNAMAPSLKQQQFCVGSPPMTAAYSRTDQQKESASKYTS
ncbi:hypothetical protein NCU07594 [Neurospora crassa OR74A]|uniref:Uncharacterized protein n=1 Tax=Neurospora crassa (strain ATCC 24698 / 74-OR23-1A / CBS 708.71 / DSM 1257 / FGSC 987) TaxID=367110 RepID=Q7SBG2_NEUCR|nr:hypothetical protein NCU07594 [Neurospora crassa OR74A]EAA33738.1 hypothetical protein NCU07594 [Neurospora crassa OR74A]|eukprot:XP_962974.1 hypothetical protein NCU07594 [Neurospora crassa OR74A]